PARLDASPETASAGGGVPIGARTRAPTPGPSLAGRGEIALNADVPRAGLFAPPSTPYAERMLLIVGIVRLPPERLDAARPVMRRMVEHSRAEDGCEGYAYAEDVLDPGLIHVTELWRDQAALDR